MEWSKGVYDVIFSAKKLIEDSKLKNYSLNFILVGEGKEKKRILDLEKRLGIEKQVVHKVVPYEKMPQEYQEADIFLAPSLITRHWQEQFGMVLIEAMACGLPIVTTLSGAIEEVVGEAAVKIQPGDYFSLTKAIKNFILNPKARMEYGKKARQRAVKYFDIEIGAKKLEEVYKKVLD